MPGMWLRENIYFLSKKTGDKSFKLLSPVFLGSEGQRSKGSEVLNLEFGI